MQATLRPSGDEPDERLVREYLSAVNAGRFLDALNTFSLDASFRDESGTECRGIREIAAAFARRGQPVRVEIEDVRREGQTLVARIRMDRPAARRPRVYRTVFRIHQRRIQSLEIEPQVP